MSWRARDGLRRLQDLEAAGFDATQHVEALGTKVNGNDVTIRARASLATSFYIVHVQSTTVGGGSTYSSGSSVSRTEYDARQDKQQDHTVTRNGTSHYTAWLIPVFKDVAGNSIVFDGEDGDDLMTVVDLGV